MSKLTKKERAFCMSYLETGSVADAERYSGVRNGSKLLCREDICAEIKRLSDIQRKNLSALANAGLKRLAMGSIADAVSLIYMENPNVEELRNMDLFMISEIRRKDNSTEIKFFDRFKALGKLSEAENEGAVSIPFYDALEAGAAKLDKLNGD